MTSPTIMPGEPDYPEGPELMGYAKVVGKTLPVESARPEDMLLRHARRVWKVDRVRGADQTGCRQFWAIALRLKRLSGPPVATAGLGPPCGARRARSRARSSSRASSHQPRLTLRGHLARLLPKPRLTEKQRKEHEMETLIAMGVVAVLLIMVLSEGGSLLP